MTREVISLLGLMAAFVFSAWGYPYVAGVLAPITSLVWLRHAIGVVTIFAVTILGYLMLAMLVSRMVKAVGLSLPDRVLGGLFGVVKIGVLIAAVLILATRFYPDLTTRVTTGSILAPHLFRTADVITTLLPRDIQTDFDRAYRRMSRFLGTTLPIPQPPSSSGTQAAPSGISPHDDQALRRLIRERTRDP